MHFLTTKTKIRQTLLAVVTIQREDLLNSWHYVHTTVKSSYPAEIYLRPRKVNRNYTSRFFDSGHYCVHQFQFVKKKNCIPKYCFLFFLLFYCHRHTLRLWKIVRMPGKKEYQEILNISLDKLSVTFSNILFFRCTHAKRNDCKLIQLKTAL